MTDHRQHSRHENRPLTLKSLHAHQRWWANMRSALSVSNPKGVAILRKAWRRSWLGGVAWPWCRREVEIVGKVAGVVTLSFWLKRLIEQFLSSRLLNESILRGEMSDVVRDVEQEIDTGRTRHGRRKQ
jgi:hypothetical protein